METDDGDDKTALLWEAPGVVYQHRQELWDQMLIENWLKDRTMWAVIASYRLGCGYPEQMQHYEEFLAKVKRAPRVFWEMRRPVRAFMADALPTTSRWLWAGARGERVMRILTTESRVKPHAIGRHLAGDIPDRHKTRMQEQANRMPQWDGTRLRDWHKVK